MKLRLIGVSDKPAVVVVGTWDPLTPGHVQLVRRLARRAHEVDGCAAAVLLDPPPAAILHGRWKVTPTTDDPRHRVAMLRSAGADAVITVAMTRRDLDLGVREFLAALLATCRIREFWIRPHQSFGRGPGGTRATLESLAARHGIATFCPRVRSERVATERIRLALSSGRLRRVSTVLSRAPTWLRPRRGVLRLNWPPGWYEVRQLPSSGDPAAIRTTRVRLRLGPRGEAVLTWPGEHISGIAFLRGPADL